ncbi:MAG TPA: hypothetical protein VJ947_02930, partial [Pseudohaliea sp.]|nr:hypothetical protein [Pseudohaliea sp.]
MTSNRSSLPGPTLLLAVIALGVGACQANPPVEDEPSVARMQQPEATAPEASPGAAGNDSTPAAPEQQQVAQANPASSDPAPAADPPAAGSGSVEGNLYFVQTLIERSSMAQKVASSANPDALAKRDQARA